ncbi:MAG TPA: hypothetical protein VF614_12930 [Chthoniobacteraceae bacterium]
MILTLAGALGESGEELTLERVHQRYVEWFVESKGFGMERIVRPGNFLAHGRMFAINKAEFSVREITLVSLLKHKTPVAYELRNSHIAKVHTTDPAKPAEKDAIAKLPTRKLASFESTALEEIRAGGTVVFETLPSRAWSAAQLKALVERRMAPQALPQDAVMVGALRATAACLKCHDVEEGDLLGLLSYRLWQRVDQPAPAVVTP